MKRTIIALLAGLVAYYFAVSVTWSCVYKGLCGSVFDSEVFGTLTQNQACTMVTLSQHCLTILAGIIAGTVFASALLLWGLRFGYYALIGLLIGAGLMEAYYWFGVHHSLHFDPKSNISLFYGIWVGFYVLLGSFVMLLIISGLFRRSSR